MISLINGVIPKSTKQLFDKFIDIRFGKLSAQFTKDRIALPYNLLSEKSINYKLGIFFPF